MAQVENEKKLRTLELVEKTPELKYLLDLIQENAEWSTKEAINVNKRLEAMATNCNDVFQRKATDTGIRVYDAKIANEEMQKLHADERPFYLLRLINQLATNQVGQHIYIEKLQKMTIWLNDELEKLVTKTAPLIRGEIPAQNR